MRRTGHPTVHPDRQGAATERIVYLGRSGNDPPTGDCMRNRTISWLGLSVLLAGCSSAGSAPLLRISDTVPERPAAPVPGAVSADTVPPEPEPEVPPPATIESERAVQLEGVYRTRATRIQRLHDLALPLLRGGVALCDGDGVELGFRYSTLDQFATREERSAWEAVLGLGSRPTIWMVIAGSAADRAGMRPGDVIASMGGLPFPRGCPMPTRSTGRRHAWGARACRFRLSAQGSS